MLLRISALLALCSIAVWPSGASANSGAGRLGAINHIVVIYEENHSFDNLYGGWEGVNGLHERGCLRSTPTQVSQAGSAPYNMPAAERRHPDLAATAGRLHPAATTAHPAFSEHALHERAVHASTTTSRRPPRPARSRRTCSRRTGSRPRAAPTCRADALEDIWCTASTRSSTSSTAASRIAT